MASSILVFRPGQLGDTIAALPALHVIRETWPDARITLLHDVFEGSGFPTGRSVLEGSGLVDDFLSYRPRFSALGRLGTAAGLVKKLRAGRFEVFVYLAPILRTPKQRKRDVWLARMAGIPKICGDVDFAPPSSGFPRGSVCPHEADMLLDRLSASGLRVPPAKSGVMDLRLSEAEKQAGDAWLKGENVPSSRRLLAVGPGSKMPAKRWPVDRFVAVVKSLVEGHGVWPIVFGGPEDAPMGKEMTAAWRCGSVAAGKLSVRESAAAISRTSLFLGNDTGTMHLAAAAGVPCVALFSARDTKGTWYPYGDLGHVVFRENIECEGCMLTECLERDNECLKRIDAVRVTEACARLLASPSRSPHAAC